MNSPDGAISQMKWHFPTDNSMREIGMNSLKFDTSDDAVKMFVRELCQNSCDATAGGKVRIEFDLFHLRKEDFPDRDAFSTVLARCKKTVSNLDRDQSSLNLMFDMIDAFNEPSIPVLRASDFGTTGATGSGIGKYDEQTPWKAMTLGFGISNKGGKSAGSFGRGKESFFAVSQFHTVFFSTNDVEGKCASIGCSELITHYDQLQNKYASFGICGNSEYTHNYSVPGLLNLGNYSRAPEDKGTDVFIMGYSLISHDWADRILLSAVTDFFIKIIRDELEIKAGSKTINSGNIAEEVQRLIDKYPREANDLKLLQEQIALLSGEPLFRNEIFSLYLQKSENYGHIATVRGGMLIDKRFKACPSAVGLLIIENDRASRLLAKCEPTNHDRWVKNNIQNLAKNDRKEIISILDEINQTVAQIIEDFCGVSEAETQDAEGLEKYLSIHQDTPEQIKVARKEANWGPIATVKPKRKKKVIKRKKESDSSEADSAEMAASDQDPDEQFRETGAVDRKDKDRGEAERNFKPDENGDMKRVFKLSSSIKMTNLTETCRKDDARLHCTFIFDINKEEEYYIRVNSVMKGGALAEPIPIIKAVGPDGNELPIVDGYYAGPITASKSSRNKIDITLNYPAICDFSPEVFEYAD